jgi:hypothetical protein
MSDARSLGVNGASGAIGAEDAAKSGRRLEHGVWEWHR